jgi:hypothetical protein
MTSQETAIICDNIKALTTAQVDLLLRLLNPQKSLRQISEETLNPQVHQSKEAKEQHYLYVRKLASELYKELFEGVELAKGTPPRQYLFQANSPLQDCASQVV